MGLKQNRCHWTVLGSNPSRYRSQLTSKGNRGPNPGRFPLYLIATKGALVERRLCKSGLGLVRIDKATTISHCMN